MNDPEEVEARIIAYVAEIAELKLAVKLATIRAEGALMSKMGQEIREVGICPFCGGRAE